MNEDPTRTPLQGADHQNSLITHAVLVGLTPLIPVPFVDDLVRGHLMRRMVRALAAAHGRSLSNEEVQALTEDRGGCLGGCAGQLVLYPIKKIFRKVFYFLEWKRAVDLTSRTYHHGYLVDYAFASPERFAGKTAAELRDAVEAVCREAPVKPIESAVATTFRKSKGVVRSAANLLAGALRRGGGARPDGKRVAQAVESVEAEEERELAPVTSGLQSSIARIPEEHFRLLRARLDARLGVAPETRGGL